MKSLSVRPVPWPRTLSVMFGLAIVALATILLLALAQSSHRTRAEAKPALVVPAPAEAPPALVVPAPADVPHVDPLFDVDRIERLLKRGEKPTQSTSSGGRTKGDDVHPGHSGDLKVIWDRHSRVEGEAARQ